MSENIYHDGFGNMTGIQDKTTGTVLLKVEYVGLGVKPDSIPIPKEAIDTVIAYLKEIQEEGSD